jgi:SAM-dependent methyltransferase
MLSRNEKFLSHVNREMKILEIGPSISPTLTRADGWNVFSVDHLDAVGLRAKYAFDPTVDTSRIQEVDFISHGRALDLAVDPEHLGTFDCIIGSHVIEHFPDLIGFFLSAQRILKPRGVLSLVVPDKRFCFDYFKPISLTGDVLEAHHARRVRHSGKTAFNGAAYGVKSGGRIAWERGTTEPLSFVFDLSRAYEAFNAENDPSTPYRDRHGWYFTPASFRLIRLELAAVGLISFEEIGFFPTEGCEFFVTLQQTETPDTEALQDRRMDYLRGMILEARDFNSADVHQGGERTDSRHRH